MADGLQEEAKQGRVLDPPPHTHTHVYLYNIFTTKGSYVNPAKWKNLSVRYAISALTQPHKGTTGPMMAN